MNYNALTLCDCLRLHRINISVVINNGRITEIVNRNAQEQKQKERVSNE